MTEISFTVPGQPVGKARARVTRHGTYTPATTVGYEERIIVAARSVDRPALAPEGAAVRLSILFRFAMPKSWSKTKRDCLSHNRHTQKPDLDNLLKAVKDALNGVCYFDDAQVAVVYALKTWSDSHNAEGETQITVSW